jgi:hypothetical protein
MRKKTATTIQLVLISSVLASCSKDVPENHSTAQKVFMRADSTAPYTDVTKDYQQQYNSGGGMGSALLWFMAFRHLGGGLGYATNGLHPSSVNGTNTAKAAAYTRNGFGQKAQASRSSTYGS